MTLIEYVAIIVITTMLALFFPSILTTVWTCVLVIMQAVVLIMAAIAVIITLNIILDALFSNKLEARGKIWKF